MVAETITAGMRRQDVTMKINQIFSLRHRGIIFIGALNSPLHKPDRRAKRIPSVTGSTSE